MRTIVESYRAQLALARLLLSIQMLRHSWPYKRSEWRSTIWLKTTNVWSRGTSKNGSFEFDAVFYFDEPQKYLQPKIHERFSWSSGKLRPANSSVTIRPITAFTAAHCLRWRWQGICYRASKFGSDQQRVSSEKNRFTFSVAQWNRFYSVRFHPRTGTESRLQIPKQKTNNFILLASVCHKFIVNRIDDFCRENDERNAAMNTSAFELTCKTFAAVDQLKLVQLVDVVLLLWRIFQINSFYGVLALLSVERCLQHHDWTLSLLPTGQLPGA